MQVIVLPMLGDEAIIEILRRGWSRRTRSGGAGLAAPRSPRRTLGADRRGLSSGDARIALNILEGSRDDRREGNPSTGAERLREGRASGRCLPYGPRPGEEHFTTSSRRSHKSLTCGVTRDAGGSTGWRGCSRAGEDPLYVARRLMRFALGGDVGLGPIPEALRLFRGGVQGRGPFSWGIARVATHRAGAASSST